MDDSRRCTAMAHHTKQRCKKAAILGGVVCQTHGGGAPQVKKAARERLNDLIDPAINELGRRVEDRDNPALALRAAQDILDRAGYKSPAQIDLHTTVGQAEEETLRHMSDEKLAELKVHTAAVVALMGA